MNAITYARVSTDEQADKGYSLSHQKELLTQHCEFSKITILKHFVDDFSAKTFDRPSWNKLLEYLRANKKDIDLILITKWDRFSRNQEAALVQIRELGEMGIKVNAVEQPLDLENHDQKVLLSLYLIIPEVENDKNSDRTKDGMRRAMKEGCYLAKAPFGYKNDRDVNSNATLIPDSNSPLVKKAFELIATGAYAMEEVRKIIREQGYSANKESFRLLLKRDVYRGKIFIKQYKKEEAQIVNGLHKPIVSDDLFFKVQEILNGRKKKQFKIQKLRPELPLKGFLKCKRCGGNITGSRSTSQNGNYHFYYHCQKGCRERFRADKANDAFQEYLSTLIFGKEVIDLFREIVSEVFKIKEGDRALEINKLHKEIKHLESQLESAEDKFYDNKISVNDYNKAKERYSSKIRNLKSDIESLKSQKSNLCDYLDYGVSLIANFDLFYSNSEMKEKQLLLGSILEEKMTHDDGIYRTNKPNSVMSLLLALEEDFKGYKRKKVGIFTNLSNQAPPLGLEPRTY